MNETIKHIVAEMRIDCRARHMDGTMYREEDWVYTKATANKLADRIEAAAKREREAGAEAAQVCGEIGEMIGREAAGKDSVQVGNAAAMRDALSEISNLADALDIDNPNVVAILDQCRDALAEPERNCDVGTAEEQAERFAEYCDSEACKRNRCKSRAKALCIERCAIAWAQMPYEEGGAK